MQAVRWIKFEFRPWINGDFVDLRRTEMTAWIGKLQSAFFKAYLFDIFLFYEEMAGLVLFVHCPRPVEALCFAESEPAVRSEGFYFGFL